MYVGTVIFGPATALSVATGIDVWLMILICAAVGTIYTAVGGRSNLVSRKVKICLYLDENSSGFTDAPGKCSLLHACVFWGKIGQIIG